MMASTERDSTRAVSATVSPRPSWVPEGSSTTAWPPSWVAATSKETRVRVDGFSKIIASVLPASGLASPSLASPRFMRTAVSSMTRSSALSKPSRSRKCRGGAGCSVVISGRLRDGAAGALDGLHGFFHLAVLDDERRQQAHDVLGGANRQQPLLAQPRDQVGVGHDALQAQHEAEIGRAHV